MDGIIFILFFIFFVLPIIKGIFGNGKSAKGGKTADRVRRELEARVKAQQQKTQNTNKNPWKQKNKHGHSKARQRAHDNMHSRDGDSNVFPEEHLARVRKRDLRDKLERARMEKNIHRSENTAIRRIGNKGVDDWGARGDGIGGGGAIVVLALGALAAYFVISNYFPDMLG